MASSDQSSLLPQDSSVAPRSDSGGHTATTSSKNDTSSSSGHVSVLHISHLPPARRYRIYAAVFTRVFNATFLRSRLLAGDRAYDYAFVDAAMIMSSTHLSAAIFRALSTPIQKRKSRSLHAEIILSLGFTNNIGANLGTFGIKDSSSEIIAVKVLEGGSQTELVAEANHTSTNYIDEDTEKADVETQLNAIVQGAMCPFTGSSIAQSTRWMDIRRVYKLDEKSSASGGNKQKKPKKGEVNKGNREIEKVEADEKAKSTEVGNSDQNQDLIGVQGTQIEEIKEIEATVLGGMALRGNS